MADLRNEPFLREVIERATEIEVQTQHLAASDEELGQFLKASEEAGISRDATLQALRERLDFKPEAYKEGQLVFARSQDERFHPARIASVDADGATVRYLNGGEARVPMAGLRPFALGPGQRLEYNSPSWAMWVTGEVVRVNLEGGSVTLTTWGVEETVPLERLRSPKLGSSAGLKDMSAVVGYSIVSFLAGGVGGAILMWLLRR
jgi:hypothetical protein